LAKPVLILLSNYVGLGLSNTTYIMSAVLTIVLVFQFAQKRYVPWTYWLTLATTFALWYAMEKTLSIHTIFRVLLNAPPARVWVYRHQLPDKLQI